MSDPDLSRLPSFVAHRIAEGRKDSDEVAALLRWLDEIGANRDLLDPILWMEERLDREGCVHSAEEIVAGQCDSLSRSFCVVVRRIGAEYADRPGYREEWRP